MPEHSGFQVRGDLERFIHDHLDALSPEGVGSPVVTEFMLACAIEDLEDDGLHQYFVLISDSPINSYRVRGLMEAIRDRMTFH